MNWPSEIGAKVYCAGSTPFGIAGLKVFPADESVVRKNSSCVPVVKLRKFCRSVNSSEGTPVIVEAPDSPKSSLVKLNVPKP